MISAAKVLELHQETVHSWHHQPIANLYEGPWKLVVTHRQAKPGTFGNEKVELYHLAHDLAEQNDLIDVHPQRAAAMLAQLKAWYADTQDSATPQPGGWLGARSRKK